MKPGKSTVSAILAALCASPAFAEPKFLDAVTSAKVPFKIALIDAKTCEASLSAVHRPAALIQRGLETLADANRMPSHPVDCLEDYFNERAKEMDPGKSDSNNIFITIHNPLPAPVNPRIPELRTEMAKLMAGESGWNAADRKRYNELEAEDQELRHRALDLNELSRELGFVLVPPPSVDETRLKQLFEQARCYRSPFEKEDCEIRTAAEQAKLDLEIKAERDRLEKSLEPYRRESVLWESFFRQRLTASHADNAELIRHATPLFCEERPLIYGVSRTRSISSINRLCPKKSASKQQPQAALQKLHGKLAGLRAEFSSWKKAHLARELAEKAKVQARVSERLHQYDHTRLLARYTAQVRSERNGAPPLSLREFCAKYAAEQESDLGLIASGWKVRPFETSDDWAFAREFGLTEGKLTALKLFTGEAYRGVNQALRAGAALEGETQTFVAHLNRALADIPQHHGPVLRFVTLPPDALDEHRAGKIVTYQGFTSTSHQPDWSWSGTHRLLIYGRSGRAVWKISQYPKEGEVIFAPGSRFKVLSRKEKEGASRSIEFVLAEVDEYGSVIAEVPKDAGQ